MVFNTNANEDLSAGMNAPDFVLVDQNNIERSLSDFKGEWVVLYFYPKDDTPGCTTEACSFRDNMEIISKLNANILGVSVDSQESHKEFSEKYLKMFFQLYRAGHLIHLHQYFLKRAPLSLD